MIDNKICCHKNADSISIIDKPTITISTRGAYGIPFYKEIENIWLGYRICYYKNVDFDDAIPTDIKLLKEAYIEDQVEVALKCKAFCERYDYDDGYTGDMDADYFREIYRKQWDRHVSNDEDYRESKTTKDVYVFDGVTKEWYRFVNACKHIKKHLNHESPFEHGVISFTLKNVSRSLTHQIVRHRLTSISQQSQRYVGEQPDELTFVIPRKIKEKPEALSVVNKYLSQLGDAIVALKELGIKNEDIRCLYPNAMPSDISMTMNFRELKHLIELRTDSHAQDEIRWVAYQLWKFMATHVPFVWTNVI